MDATERYLFDLNGYLALPGVLPASTLDAINALMDERIAQGVLPSRSVAGPDTAQRVPRVTNARYGGRPTA